MIVKQSSNISNYKKKHKHLKIIDITMSLLIFFLLNITLKSFAKKPIKMPYLCFGIYNSLLQIYYYFKNKPLITGHLNVCIQ